MTLPFFVLDVFFPGDDPALILDFLVTLLLVMIGESGQGGEEEAEFSRGVEAVADRDWRFVVIRGDNFEDAVEDLVDGDGL